MRRFVYIPIAGLIFLTACNSEKKPSSANFAAAIIPRTIYVLAQIEIGLRSHG